MSLSLCLTCGHQGTRRIQGFAPAGVVIKVHAVDSGCFAITLRKRVEGNSHMDVVGWLTQEARHILMQAGLANGWKASSFSGPHRMLDDDREYAITMYYVHK